jgi:hypothetical protein
MKQNNFRILIIILLIVIILLFLLFKKYNYIEKYNNINTKIVFNNTIKYNSGFFSYFCFFLVSLIDNPNIVSLDYNVISNPYESATYYVNKGEKIFEKIFVPYETNKEIHNVIQINDFNPKSPATKLYFDDIKNYNENRKNLQPFNDVYKKFIIIQPHIQEKINYHIQKLNEGNPEKTVGILVRSAAVWQDIDQNSRPTREKYLNIINKLNENNKNIKYFLCIDNNEDLNYYKKILTPNYYLDINRSDTNKGDAPHKNTALKSLDELEKVFIQVAVLSSCHILVHPNSNMATASLIMNMEQQSILVR